MIGKFYLETDQNMVLDVSESIAEKQDGVELKLFDKKRDAEDYVERLMQDGEENSDEEMELTPSPIDVYPTLWLYEAPIPQEPGDFEIEDSIVCSDQEFALSKEKQTDNAKTAEAGLYIDASGAEVYCLGE